jgi:hypothetical protein
MAQSSLSEPNGRGRVGLKGQADRAAETQALIDRMRDPSDPYQGEHPEGEGK